MSIKEAKKNQCNCTRAERVTASAFWDGWILFLSCVFIRLITPVFRWFSLWWKKMVSLFCLPWKKHKKTSFKQKAAQKKKSGCCYWWMEQSNHRRLFCLHFFWQQNTKQVMCKLNFVWLPTSFWDFGSFLRAHLLSRLHSAKKIFAILILTAPKNFVSLVRFALETFLSPVMYN